MVGTANDVGNLHVDVVDHDAQMIGRHAVRAQQDKIFDRCEVVLDAAKHLIGKFDFSCGWHFEAKDLGLALAFSLLDLGRPSGCGKCHHTSRAALPEPQPHAWPSATPQNKSMGRLCPIPAVLTRPTILLQPLRLEERSFVPVQSQPAHALENAFHHFGRRPLDVRVFNAKDELSVVMLCEEPIEEGGSGATDVEVAGWGGSEANSNLGQRRFSCRKISLEETANREDAKDAKKALAIGYRLFSICCSADAFAIMSRPMITKPTSRLFAPSRFAWGIQAIRLSLSMRPSSQPGLHRSSDDRPLP